MWDDNADAAVLEVVKHWAVTAIKFHGIFDRAKECRMDNNLISGHRCPTLHIMTMTVWPTSNNRQVKSWNGACRATSHNALQW